MESDVNIGILTINKNLFLKLKYLKVKISHRFETFYETRNVIDDFY